MRVLLILSLLWSALSHSATLKELEDRQWELAREHAELLRTTPSSLTIANLSLDPMRQEEVRDYLDRIRIFFKHYDDFNLDKIDFFHEEALRRAEIEVELYLKSHKRLTKKMQTYLSQFKAARALYLERKIFFGTERDMERLDIGQEVLSYYGMFAKEIRKKNGQKVKRNFGSAKIVPFVDKPTDFIKVMDRFVVLLWTAYFRNNTGRADSAPIPESLQGTQRRLVKMRNIETKWEGMENLGDVSHDGKTLNMFLINHANSFYDTSAQQAFPVEGISVMGNVDIFFPDFLAKQMVKSDHMITVGHGDTTGKTIELVRKKQLNKFFLAIEGITGTGLYEMRPVMPLFHEAVYESLERGLELKLYPIAFPDNFRLLNDWRDPIEGKMVARGVLMKPFNSEHCLSLKKSTGTIDAISQLIRWSWFSTLNTNEDELLSMPYPTEIARRLELMIWGEN